MADISIIQLSDNTQYNLKDAVARSALTENDTSTGDISKIQLSDNTQYNIKDAQARQDIETVTTDVKAQVNADKDLINGGTAFIDDETLDDYDDKIAEMQEAYKKFIPIQTASGTEITLDNSSNDKALLDIGLDGNIEQDGEPTPDYPQEVNVVTGENTIEIIGQNWYDGTYTSKKFVKKSDGTIATGDDWSATDYIKIEPSTNYIYSGITNNWSNHAGGAFYNDNKEFISGFNSNVYSFTSPNNAKYLRMSLNSETPSNIQLQKGSTAAPYEPYQSQSHEIYLGVENLWKEIPNATKQGVTCTYNDDGSYTLNGTAIANASFYITVNYPAGTYTLSANNLETIGGSNYLLIESSGGNSGRYSRTMDVEDAKRTFTTTYTLQAVVIVVSSGTTFDNFTFKPQLEKGSIKHDFWKYGIAPIELCKIEDYKDKIYNNDKKWYLHKEIGKVVLDGSESYWYDSSYPRFIVPISGSRAEAQRNPIYSDYFHYISQGTQDGGAFIYNLQLYLYDFSQTSSSDLKAWLSTHNTTVYYQLATPTVTEITDSNLISQLEAVKLLSGTQNNFTIDADTLPTLNLNYIGEANPHL